MLAKSVPGVLKAGAFEPLRGCSGARGYQTQPGPRPRLHCSKTDVRMPQCGSLEGETADKLGISPKHPTPVWFVESEPKQVADRRMAQDAARHLRPECHRKPHDLSRARIAELTRRRPPRTQAPVVNPDPRYGLRQLVLRRWRGANNGPSLRPSVTDDCLPRSVRK